MKKDTFIVFMFVETLLALMAMGLMFSDVGALIYPISLALFAVVLCPFCLRLRKTVDEEKKRKIRRNMALLMLLPIVAGAIAYLTVVIILIIAFM